MNVLATRELSSLPGPKELPFLGSALVIRPARFHRQLEEWAERFGPVYRFSIGPRPYVCLSDHALIDSVLRARPQVFRRARRLERISRDFGYLGVFAAEGTEWRRHRQLVMAGLDPRHVRSFLPALVQVTERLRRKWQAMARDGRAMELVPELMRYTVDVTSAMAFGQSLNTIEKGDHESVQQHLNVIFPRLMRRLLAPIDTDHYLGNYRIARHLKALDQVVAQFISATRAQLEQDGALREKPQNMIQSMLVARDRPGSGFSDADVAGNVFTMLLAGEDTTAYMIAWTLWLLHRNPPAMQRAQAEVDQVLGAGRMAGSMEQLAAMDYLEACAHEALRLKPVAPLIVNEAIEDTLVGDLRVPRDTTVMCIMRSASWRADSPDRVLAFDPGRWLAQANASPSPEFKRANMPFGAGARICPGRFLALAELKLLVSMLLANFEIEDLSTEDGGEPEEGFAFVMSPQGLRMRLRPKAEG